jgi:FtsP/CotA-like multicopper oxidase with cupredoxin domain
MNRRQLIRAGLGVACGAGIMPRLALAAGGGPDYRLSIEKTTIEIRAGVRIQTLAYNGMVPGPLLRLKQGKKAVIEVTNRGAGPDLAHWHGLRTDPLNDGAEEEGSQLIQPGEKFAYTITPDMSGTRWYHTHAMAMEDLGAGTYTGQYGFLIIETPSEPGRYDREVNLAIHHWEPEFVPMVHQLRSESHNRPQTTGSDVGYKYATMNGHTLGFGEPIRVKQGERVLFRLLNASATENTVLALPGHSFTVVAMDGNPVPRPAKTEVIALGVGERVDAIVEMTNPGKWVLGSTLAIERNRGLGIIVEYANRVGEAVWREPVDASWNYAKFANTVVAAPPHETIDMVFRDAGPSKGSRFDTWSINGESWPNMRPSLLDEGKRYRLRFVNASGDQHPMHLHRHSFEVVKIGDQQLSGLMKDVVNVLPLQTVEVDFTADNPGDTLFHCHQQLHMDFGFMQLFRYKRGKA